MLTETNKQTCFLQGFWSLSAPQLGVLIKKLSQRKGNVENTSDKIGDEQESIRAKINELAKLKLQREQDELEESLLNFRKEIMNLRFQKSMGQLEKPSRMKIVRKEIAKILTQLRSRKEKADA